MWILRFAAERDDISLIANDGVIVKTDGARAYCASSPGWHTRNRTRSSPWTVPGIIRTKLDEIVKTRTLSFNKVAEKPLITINLIQLARSSTPRAVAVRKCQESAKHPQNAQVICSPVIDDVELVLRPNHRPMNKMS